MKKVLISLLILTKYNPLVKSSIIIKVFEPFGIIDSKIKLPCKSNILHLESALNMALR
ncbi:MAG: hypothetical protein NTW25_02070 [Candidatus Kapabacteria bacterium]|nr:hypothetical protein [Candidatus Kapabacteria bacterium]